MATSTFERKIEITSPDALERLEKIMASDPPERPLSKHPYGSNERERSEEVLKLWLSRSNH